MIDPRVLVRRVGTDRASQAVVIRIVGVAFGLVQSIVVARLGGPELRGLVAVFVSASSLIHLAASFDIGQQVVRRCRTRGDFSPIGALMRTTWLIYAALGALIAAAFATIDSNISWLAIGGVAYLMGSQANAVLGAINGPVSSSWSALAQQVTLLVGVLGLAGAGVLDDTTIKLVILASFVAPLPFFAVMARRQARNAPAGTAPEASALRAQIADVFKAAFGGFPWQLGRSLQWSVVLIDTILVGAILGDAAAGIYAVGFSLTVVPRLVGTQVAVDLYHRATVNDEHTLHRDLRKAFVGTTGAALVVAVIAPVVVNVFYGPAFAEGLAVYLVLTVSVIAQAVTQVAFQFNRVYGTPWPTVVYSALGPLLMLVGADAALTTFGVVGMAWLAGLASIVMAIPAVFLARRLARAGVGQRDSTPA